MPTWRRQFVALQTSLKTTNSDKQVRLSTTTRHQKTVVRVPARENFHILRENILNLLGNLETIRRSSLFYLVFHLRRFPLCSSPPKYMFSLFTSPQGCVFVSRCEIKRESPWKLAKVAQKMFQRNVWAGLEARAAGGGGREGASVELPQRVGGVRVPAKEPSWQKKLQLKFSLARLDP